MKKILLFSLVCLTGALMSFGQITLLDFESVSDPLVEDFDLTSYESAVSNPNGDGAVGKVVKAGWAFWGGVNIYFGGDVVFSGTNDTVMIDFYTTDAGLNDSILFKFQLFNRMGGVETIEVDGFYTDANDTEVGVWKTLKFPLPDGITGSYNQIVIFFGWSYATDGDIYYFDNVVVPGFNAYTDTDVTFNITDKFNNATDVKLFIDGADTPLTQEGNLYSNTTSLAPHTILLGQSTGIYEIVYSHMANGVEIRDTTSLICGSPSGAQELIQLIIVEELEDGTALAISVGGTPPVIDGTVDDVWSNAKTHTLQERSWWGSPTGMYTTWKIMWDIDNLYLLYMVEDATPYNSAPVNAYENDCIETFFDMNQSAGTPYDADDWQIRTIRSLDSWTGSANVTDDWGQDLQRAQSMMAEDAGYIIELAIPWTSLSASFLPLVGKEFNFDASSTDVGAGGGARLFREAWTTNEDKAYNNTVDFGTITLSDKTNEGGGTAVENREVAKISLYPNPASEMVTVRSGVEISSIRILDMTGRTVSSISSIHNSTTTVNVSDLAGGVYLINISDMEGGISVRKLRVH